MHRRTLRKLILAAVIAAVILALCLSDIRQA
jgi:hypothetical protein